MRRVIPGKRCTKCKKLQPLGRFVRDKNRRNGRHPVCSPCIRKYQKAWALRPDVKIRNRAYQLEFSRTPSRKAQISAYQKKIMPSGLTRARQFKMKSYYGLSVESYLSMLDGQGGACATCRREFSSLKQPAQIDHCHATGVIRGLLCIDCNIALGKVREESPTLLRMVDYLEQSKCGA